MITWTSLTRFIYIFARMSGCVLMNPITGRRNLPNTFRSGLVMVFSLFIYPGAAEMPIQIPVGIPDLAIHILMEMLLGFFLGMIIHFFLYIPQLAGLMVDTQMGMTMNQIYDAGAQGNVSVTGQFLNVLMLLLFFAANGHHTLIEIMLTSGQVVPFGQISIGTEALDAMLLVFWECTVLAVKLCMPILAAELVGQVGMGILMKAIPQINVFSINIELKVLIGLVLLFLLIAPMSEFLLKAEMEMLDSMRQILTLAG